MDGSSYAMRVVNRLLSTLTYVRSRLQPAVKSSMMCVRDEKYCDTWKAEFHRRVKDSMHMKYVFSLSESQLEKWIPTCFVPTTKPSSKELFEYLHCQRKTEVQLQMMQEQRMREEERLRMEAEDPHSLREIEANRGSEEAARMAAEDPHWLREIEANRESEEVARMAAEDPRGNPIFLDMSNISREAIIYRQNLWRRNFIVVQRPEMIDQFVDTFWTLENMSSATDVLSSTTASSYSDYDPSDID